MQSKAREDTHTHTHEVKQQIAPQNKHINNNMLIDNHNIHAHYVFKRRKEIVYNQT